MESTMDEETLGFVLAQMGIWLRDGEFDDMSGPEAVTAARDGIRRMLADVQAGDGLQNFTKGLPDQQ